MKSPKMGGSSPEKMDSGSFEKENAARELQNNLEHYFSAFWGYQDRPEEILEEAKKQEISLDLDAATKKGIIKALEGEAPENLDLIIAFSKKHQITIDLAQPDIQRAVEHCFAILLSKTKSAELSDLKKFIDKHKISINENGIFQQAIVICLNLGYGQRVNNLADKIIKEKRKVNFSDPKIMEALRQVVLINLRGGRADLVNRLIGFASRGNCNIETNEPELINAANEGLIKSIKDIRHGPGSVTIAEGMVKLIQKLKLPINLNSPEIVRAGEEALEASKKTHEAFPKELQKLSARLHIEDFLKKCGINID